jgi:hypothetical protein
VKGNLVGEPVTEPVYRQADCNIDNFSSPDEPIFVLEAGILANWIRV